MPPSKQAKIITRQFTSNPIVHSTVHIQEVCMFRRKYYPLRAPDYNVWSPSCVFSKNVDGEKI